MDLTKVKAAIVNAQTEVKNAVDAEIKARSFGHLKGLATVDTWLTDCTTKLDKLGTPKAKREKKSSKK